MNGEPLVLETQGPEQTERLGSIVAGMLERGGVVALTGELASGKTCFVRGMAARFGAAGNVHSPTFTLINEYGDSPKLYHVDLYRLNGPAEVEDLGCTELFEGPDLCAIEWADRAHGLLPQRRVDILFEHVDEDCRRITLRDSELLPPDWRDRLAGAGFSAP